MASFDFLVSGILHKTHQPANLQIIQTSKGFKQRGDRELGLNRDYVSNETMKDLRQWMKVDFSEFTIHQVESTDKNKMLPS